MRDTCDGLVIRECAYGENDRIVTVLTAERGQMVMIAKGARSLKSKTMSVCRLFIYANFEYYEKNGRYWLSGGSINDSFFGLNSDIGGFALASYVVQLAAEITGEGVPAAQTLQMTLNTLYAIEKKLKPYPQLKSAYEIFAINESGFSPDLDGCGRCGENESRDGAWLDIMNGRLLCSKCMRERNGSSDVPPTDEFQTQNILVPIDDGAIGAWRYVSSAPLKRVFAFSFKTEDSMQTLGRATEKYIVNHLERSFETLEFYNTVKD